jgi:CheY-like chemotaxis protein
MSQARFTILLVEDDSNDVLLIRKALEGGGIDNPVQTVSDGEEAIDYLQGCGAFSDRRLFPLPGLIVTDLKMPRANGIEFLRWLRSHPFGKVIPAIVLTSSMEPADVQDAYSSGANSYLVKPAGFGELKRMLRTVVDYWSLCEMAPLESLKPS